jgi:hypothetical protein
MNKVYFLLALLLLNFVSCTPDSLTNLIDTTQSTNGESSNTDTTTVAPKIDESRWADDSIQGTKFDRTIRIVFADGSAQVVGDDNGIVSVDGNNVTVNNTSDEKVIYELSGSSQNGSLKLYSSKKQALVLNSLELTNPNGAAINNQGKKKCYVVVNGTNSLSDGTTYSSTPADEDEKATMFSEGQLIFSGDGTLNVTAKGKSGITSDDYISIMDSPIINVTSSAGHGIRGKEMVVISGGSIGVNVSANMKKGITSDSLVYISGGVTKINISGAAAYDEEDAEYKGTAGIKADQLFEITGGTLDIINSGTGGKGISGDATGCFNGGTVRVTTSGSNYGQSSSNRWGSSSSTSVSAKGIKFDGNLFFNGGTVVVNCSAHEGIESKGNIVMKGGVVYSYSAADDAINSAGTFTIEDGKLCGYAVRNDGLDANGNFYIKGGLVYAIGTTSPEVAIDANTEGGYKLYVQGGTLIAIGGLESGASLTQSCYSASWNKSTWYSMTVGNEVFAFKTPSSGGNTLVVSGASQPALKSGITVSGGSDWFEGLIKTDGSISGGSDVTLSTYTGGNGGGFGPGGGGGPGGPGGRPGGW